MPELAHSSVLLPSEAPKDTPRLEMFNRTLREERLEFSQMSEDLEKLTPSLTDWMISYNAVRPHQSLGYLTLLEFAGEYTELLPMCSTYIKE
jgi:transposase InsO family protein